MTGSCSVGGAARYPVLSGRARRRHNPSRQMDGAPRRRSENITLALATVGPVGARGDRSTG